MTPVPFRIHGYSIGLPCTACSARSYFFTAIHSPITQSQITDYKAKVTLISWHDCDINYSIRPTRLKLNTIFAIAVMFV